MSIVSDGSNRRQVTPTYGDLFNHLGFLKEADRHMCDSTLRHTKQFAEMHGLSFEDLSRTLEEIENCCDCEVLLNAAHRIPYDDVIGQETFKQHVQIAIDMGFYCRCLVESQPVKFTKAIIAQAAGCDVRMCVPCSEHDHLAMPDVDRAMANGHDPEDQ